MFKINKNIKGFTLIELLIVIAIIGILAAIAIPAYSSYTKKSKFAGIINSMGAVKNAIMAYYTESGAAKDASDIKATYGVDPATQYATYTVAGAAGYATITATVQNLSSDLNTKTLTLSTSDFKTWTWGGSVDSLYLPKN